MEKIQANIFANTKCPSCREEWNNETGEIFAPTLAQLLRKRSGTHLVPATLCAECQESETWRTVQRCAGEVRNLSQELANASMRRDIEACSAIIDDIHGLLVAAQGVFPARSARSLARPAIIAHNRYSIEYTKGNTMGTTVIEDVTITESILDDGRTEHRATLSDGEWIATYIDPPAPINPGQGSFYWDSLEGFHQWIRWARKP